MDGWYETHKPYRLMGLILPSNVPLHARLYRRSRKHSKNRAEGTAAPKSACTIYRTRMKMWAQECNINYRVDKLKSEGGGRGPRETRDLD